MFDLKKINLKKDLIVPVKILIVAFSLWFIYKQVIEKEDLDDFLKLYSKLAEHRYNWINFFFIVVLMVINWYLEAYKWKVLVDKFEKITVFRALRATFSGIIVSFFTPNRVGEFAGRILHISPTVRIQAALATLIGSASQLMVTCIIGSLGFAYFLPTFLNLELPYTILLWIIAFIATGLLLQLFFHFGFLSKVLHHLRILDRFGKYVDVFKQYSSFELKKILLLSFLRYLVFAAQFVWLLQLMGVNLSFFFLAGLVSVVYLTLTVIPSIAITELPVRGSVAVFIIGQYSSEHLGILCAAFTLWFINLVIPAAIGSLSILYFKIKR